MKFPGFIQSIIVAVFLILLLINAKGYEQATNTDDPATPATVYRIGIYDSLDSTASGYIVDGFKAALEDLNRKTNTEFEYEEIRYSQLESMEGGENLSLLLTIGNVAFYRARGFSDSVPILTGGIKDYTPYISEPEVSISPPEDIIDHDADFTGICALPNMEMTLSTIIEATPRLSKVALIYSNSDADAIYQNGLLEALMDEAGIGWKEYPVGRGISFDPEQIRLAARECDVLFISADSILKNYVSRITDIAAESGVLTVGGDEFIGLDTVVSVFTDEFDQGYRLGKQAHSVLSGDSSVKKLPIEYVPPTMVLRTYSPERAGAFGLTFPKSFWDVNVIVHIYAPGSMTTRV